MLVNNLPVEICERRYQYHVIDLQGDFPKNRDLARLFRCDRCHLERNLMKDFIIRYSHGEAFKKKNGVDFKTISTSEFNRLANKRKRP